MRYAETVFLFKHVNETLPDSPIPKSIRASVATVLALSADGRDMSNSDEIFGGDIMRVEAAPSVVLLSNGLGVLRDELLISLGAGGGVESKGSVMSAF